MWGRPIMDSRDSARSRGTVSSRGLAIASRGSQQINSRGSARGGSERPAPASGGSIGVGTLGPSRGPLDSAGSLGLGPLGPTPSFLSDDGTDVGFVREPSPRDGDWAAEPGTRVDVLACNILASAQCVQSLGAREAVMTRLQKLADDQGTIDEEGLRSLREQVELAGGTR